MFRRTFLYRTSIGFDPLLTQDEQFGACHLLISPTNWPQNILLPMILHILESDRYTSTPQKCVSNFFSDFINGVHSERNCMKFRENAKIN